MGLATVCDVVPLIGVNRAFVRQGLGQLVQALAPGPGGAGGAWPKPRRLSRPIIWALSSGRASMPAAVSGARSLGADLLTARDAKRRQEFAAAARSAQSRTPGDRKADPGRSDGAWPRPQDNAPFLLVAKDGWHPGVVGIVAGRLKERFAKPAFVAGFEGGMGRGSARSIPGIDIGRMVRAAREAGPDRSRRRPCHGGGLFADGRISSTASAQFLHAQFAGAEPALEAAASLELDAVSSPAARHAGAGARRSPWPAPIGAGNPEPLLAFPDLRVAFADVVGGDHVKLRLVGGDGARLDAIAFRAAGTPLGEGLLQVAGPAHPCRRASCAADDWNGRSPGPVADRGCGPGKRLSGPKTGACNSPDRPV